MRRGWGIPALAAALVLAGCGSSSGGQASGPTTLATKTKSKTEIPASTTTTTATSVLATTTVPTLPPTTVPTTAVTTIPTPTTTATTVPAAQDLAVTDQLQAELIQVVETEGGLPAGSYTGLVPGETYYAYDPSTDTYWAGAALVPSTASEQAQVSVQDDGSYHLFEQVGSGAWNDFEVGFTGIDNTACPVAVPPAVLALWGWAANTCRPADS
jgi:hypothetical protein